MNKNRKIAELYFEKSSKKLMESQNKDIQNKVETDLYYQQQQLRTLEEHLDLYKQEIAEAKKEAKFSKYVAIVSLLISIIGIFSNF